MGRIISKNPSSHYVLPRYRFGKPCILVKLNRIYGWVPEPYSIDEVRNHTSMPLSLKNDIQQIYNDKCEGKFPPEQGPCPYMNMIWLHCDGEDDPDIENIGPVTYTPFRGFPGYFYPYRNQRGYLSPIVMVQLKNPMPGVSVQRLYDQNFESSSSGSDEPGVHGVGEKY